MCLTNNRLMMGAVLGAVLILPATTVAGNPLCPADMNGDFDVGPFDLAVVLGFWGLCPDPCEPGDPQTTCQTDLNGDCDTGPFDIAFLLGAWGPCPQGPVNDDCENSIAIFDGDTAFSTIDATTDGPAHGGCEFDGQTYHDIWYHYTATCDGVLTVSTCNQADYDTDLVVYAGCNCASLNLLGCNDDTDECSGFSSEVSVPVIPGNCYLVRVGGWSQGDMGSGTVTLSCSEAGPCGDPAAGDCCAANGTPGCDNQVCCQCICACDPFCCNVLWDGFCGGNGSVGSCGASNPSGPCTAECAACLDGGPSNCCFAHPTPGCDDPECEDFICFVDPFCCQFQWDQGCADLASLCAVCQ